MTLGILNGKLGPGEEGARPSAQRQTEAMSPLKKFLSGIQDSLSIKNFGKGPAQVSLSQGEKGMGPL